MGRPGLPVVTGMVHIARAAAHHAGRPWSATADLRIGGRQVVATAEEATGTEVVDRLQDRLRRQTDKAFQPWDNGHRSRPGAVRPGGLPPPQDPTAWQRAPVRRDQL
ncbi:hypothetical protein ACICHK_01490 [Streptomyces sp. AHU1]|uniref:hypothetical protein n=1 Tax=Streptomyces sp. AHU1 TaxID=3377215 RepID=UPI003877A923